MAQDNKIMEYTVIQIEMEGVDPFYCNGIKISDQMEATDEFHGASRKRFGVTLKTQKIEFEILEPRDHEGLMLVAERCRNGESFNIFAFGENKNREWDLLHTLTGCIIPGYERTLGNHESPKIGVKGTADDSVIENTQFA